MAMNLKKKGLFKGGLKYFSQMFEEEEQQKEIQIGLPTDVKHVAHIGWDGPSTNPPSWMNEFKSQSAPLDGTGSGALNSEDGVSEVMGNASNSSARGSPGLPKSSRVRHPSMDNLGSADGAVSPSGSPTSSSSRSIKTKDKESSKSSGSLRRRKDKSSKNKEAMSTSDENGGIQSLLPNIPKKSSRRKKSKDVSDGGSVRSSTKRGSRGGSLVGSEGGGSSMSTLAEEP